MSPDPKRAAELIADLELTSRCGKVNKVVGMVAEGSGLKAPLGSLCHILPGGRADLRAARADGLIPVEVVGFRDGNTLFMPYGDLRGVQPGSLIRNSSLPPLFPAGLPPWTRTGYGRKAVSGLPKRRPRFGTGISKFRLMFRGSALKPTWSGYWRLINYMPKTAFWVAAGTMPLLCGI